MTERPAPSKKRVLVVLPTAWDAKQLESCRASWSERFEVVFAEPSDEDCPYTLDPVDFIERTADEWRGRVDGVFSSSDYPGATIAAAVAQRLGLPGAEPEHVVRTSHKYYSRLAQREAIPRATPAFQLVRPDRPEEVASGLGFPCFVKPVKGAFSLLARRIDDFEALKSFFARPAVGEFREHYMGIFNRLVRGCTQLEFDGDYFIAEELLRGEQVTVEGFCTGGIVEILGTVDSVMYPGTRSFMRFDYPSSVEEGVRLRMEDFARRAMAHLPLDQSLFNVEMIHDPETDSIHVIEINPRICGQFGDLYAKVDGTNAYEIALALAAGEQPVLRRGAGTCALASSFPLRVFEPVRVAHAPSADEVRATEAEFPGALVFNEIATGQELAEFESVEDGSSARYAVLNAGASSRAELDALAAAVQERLGYRFEALRGDASGARGGR